MFDSVFSPHNSAIFRAKTPDYVKPKSIKVNLNRLENGGANALVSAFSRAVSKALKDLEGAIATKDSKAIEKYNPILIPELQQSILGMWLGGWSLGKKHGGNEINAQQKKGTANFDEDLLDVDRASIENIPAQDAIANRVNTLASDISSNQWEKIQGHLLSAIQPQAETGEPINRSELLKRINSELGDRGFKNRAEKITRTELTFAYNAGRLQTYKDSGLVSHVVFLSILDDRRCQVCEDRHGMTIALDDVESISANTPPMHVNCRCVLSPRLADPQKREELDKDERASKKRRLFDAPPKWLAAGILAAILLSQGKGVRKGYGKGLGLAPDIAKSAEDLSAIALAAQLQNIARATGEIPIKQRRKNQVESIPPQGVIEIQPRVMLNGIDLNSASPEEIRESLKEFLKPSQLDELINYLQENKITSVDDLLSVKGISKKSKVFKILQGLADKDKLRIELQNLKTPSELWLKNLGFSRTESKAIFEELKGKPAESWDDLRQRLKKRGIPVDKLQRAIDKLKSIEAESQKKVVGLDDFVDITSPETTIEKPDLLDTGSLLKKREISLQRRQEALQEIKDLEIELAQIREDESRFNVRIRRMNSRNPKEFIAPEEIRRREARQARLQSQVEKAQRKAKELGLQLEQAKLALNDLDIPNLTPAAKSRTQTVQNLGLEGTQLSNETNGLIAKVSNEIDTQMGKGLIPPKKRLANLEQANNKAQLSLAPVDELIQKTDLEDLQSRLTQLQEDYKNLLDPLYPENYFGRDIQNELISLRAELRRTRSEIESSLNGLQKSEQSLSSATVQAEASLGRMGLLKTGKQLEVQAKDLENQIADWENRVKKTKNYESTYEPFNPTERQQPLESMTSEANRIKSQIPQFRKEVDNRFRPSLDNAKSTISEVVQQQEKLQQLQKQIDDIVGNVEKLPVTKSQIPDADIGTYNAAVELRKVSREIAEETKRLKVLAGANRVNLDESIKAQNKLYQQYEQQRFGTDTTPSWDKNLSPAVESRLDQIQGAVNKIEAIRQNWNIGFLAELGQYIEVGTDATGKALRVRKWLDDNGLSPEDLSLSSTTGGRKVGIEAIRELADEVIKQYGIVQRNAKSLQKDTQLKVFTDNGFITEDNLLKWAENQAGYWQGQKQKALSDNWQGSSYERVDTLWKSLQGKKASDVEVRKSIKSEDVQGQLRKTVGKYQDWLRKYAVMREKGELATGGMRTLDDAQKRLLSEQNQLLEQLDRYNLDSTNLINENAENARQIWEKIRQDSLSPVYFDIKGKAIERGDILKQLEDIDKQLKQYLVMQERRVEPLTYDAPKTIPLIDTRNKLSQELLEIEPKITDLQQQIQQLTQSKRGTKKLENQLAKLQTEKQVKQQQLNETVQEVRDLRLPPSQYQQIQAIKKQITETQKQVNAIQSEIAILRQELTTLADQPLGGSTSGTTRQRRMDALESAISRKNNDLFKVVDVLNSQRGELGKLRAGS